MSRPAEKWHREPIRKWAEQYSEVKNWLTKIQAKEKSAFELYRFCQWCGKMPTELLALKSNPASKEAEKLVDAFVTTEGLFTNSIKVNIVTAVKSFFKYNYCDLARACGIINLEKVKPTNKPTKEGLRKLWIRALNLRDKSLLTFTCSTAIAKETLAELQWKHLQDDWEKTELPCINVPSELLKGHGQGRYKGVRQITFLTPEAKRDLINYKEWMEQKMGRKLTSEDHIFLDIYAPYESVAYGRLGSLIFNLTRRAGVPFSLHDARRYVNTALEEIQINPNWARKIRGRKVRGEEAPYSQPAIEQLRAKFREAVPALEFTTERREMPKDVQERLMALEQEQMELKRKYGIMRKPKHIKADDEKSANCEDGGHCGGDEDCNEDKFKEVSEDELLQHLKGSWEITYRLQNGRVILKRA